GGFDFLAGTSASNASACFAILSPWDERRTSETQLSAILARARHDLGSLSSAVVVAFNPPPIRGLGSTGGFPMQGQDETSGSLGVFAATVRKLLDEGNGSGTVRGLVTALRTNVPQYAVEIDRTKAKTLGLSLSDVFGTLQVFLGGYYVNDFNRFGRVF